MISPRRKITVRMVAEAAGVSRTAVYAVLNRDAKNNIGLRPDTRRKIEKAIEELGYIPNNSARTLVSGRSNNIGILLNTSNVLFSRVIGDLLAERLNHLSDGIKKLSDELERKVSLEELSVFMDMPVEEIEDLLKLAGEGTGDGGEDTEER